MPTWTMLAHGSRSAIRNQLEASPLHAEALARLDFLAASRLPLGLIIGPAGCGKSAVLAEFARRSARQGYVVVATSLTGAGEAVILADIARGLGIATDRQGAQVWRSIQDRFAELDLESLHAVLLLDDLDRSPPESLAVVERLLNLDSAPLTIAASARPESAHRLGARILEHAALRIDLAPWNEAETSEYLSRRHVPGRRNAELEPAAARRLFELSAGAPRKVNQLVLLAEIASAGQGLKTIDEATILAVHDELTAAR